MSQVTISFEDLMRESHFEDVREFRRVLRANGFRLSERKRIPEEVASAIVKRIIGRSVNWYKYKQQVRDAEEGGPLKRATTPEAAENLGRWYTLLAEGFAEISFSRDCLVGLACVGGFLRGTDETPFLLRLHPSLNVFVGDRGSGKSTALNLLSLVTESVGEETATLVTRLVQSFGRDLGAQAELARRVRATLRRYDLDRCALYYAQANNLYCAFASLDHGVLDLFQHVEAQWSPVPNLAESATLGMHVLGQGEVLRIADETTASVGNMLDALYPDLRAERLRFAKRVRAFARQHEKFGATMMSGSVVTLVENGKRRHPPAV